MIKFLISFFLLSLILWGGFDLIKKAKLNSNLVKNIATAGVIMLSSAVSLFVVFILF